MVTSYGETSGFSVVDIPELVRVNGGDKGSFSLFTPTHADLPPADRPPEYSGSASSIPK